MVPGISIHAYISGFIFCSWSKSIKLFSGVSGKGSVSAEVVSVGAGMAEAVSADVTGETASLPAVVCASVTGSVSVVSEGPEVSLSRRILPKNNKMQINTRTVKIII